MFDENGPYAIAERRHASLTGLTEVPGTVWKFAKPTRVPGRYADVVPVLHPYPGYCGAGVQNLKFRVRVRLWFGAH